MWSYPNNVPAAVQNRPEEIQKKFIEIANASLTKGRTEQEAIVSALAQINFQGTVKKSYKKEALEKPKHISSLFKVQESVVELEDKERNLISASYDDYLRLVLKFDNGDKIITETLPVKQHIENYVNVKNSGAASVSFTKDLSGLTETIEFEEHFLNEIMSLYFLKNNKEVSVTWSFNEDKQILIESNVDLSDVKIIAYGS